jgi:hypothetical protein
MIMRRVPMLAGPLALLLAVPRHAGGQAGTQVARLTAG